MNIDVLKKLTDGKNLSVSECRQIFSQALKGSLDDAYLAAFLTAIKMKGETADEIYAGAEVLRENAVHPDINGEDMLDTCGTGGDGHGTFNVSTASAFICAAAGVKVAKHGNRSISSKCGSFDVLESLGCEILLDEKQVAIAIRQTGLGFMYAPLFHKAMKNVALVRKSLGIRTIFNILGPLVNPAGATRQLLGVYSKELMLKMANVLSRMGIARALIVHGSDGVDEITISGDTYICEINGERMEEYKINPGMFGMQCSDLDAVSGGDAVVNAKLITDIFTGKEKGPRRDMLILNAGAALYTAGRTGDIGIGTKVARDIIDNGAAHDKLREYVSFSLKLKGAAL